MAVTVSNIQINAQFNGSQAVRGLRNLSAQLRRVSAPTVSATRSLNRFSTSVGKATSGMGKLISTFKRIAFYRIIRTIIKEITEAFKEGIQNIALYSKALNGLDSNNANGVMSALATSCLYLKNALGTVAIQILSVITPAIQWLINQVVNAINVINNLIASLRGMSTFTKAKMVSVDYASSLDKANKKAKELKNTILGFDEINALNKPSNSDSDTTNPLDMFEEVPVKNTLPKWLENLMNLLKRAKDQFLKGWNEVWDKLDIANRIEKLKGYLREIGQTLKDIFTDPDVMKSMMKFFDSFFYNLGRISASLFSIGLSIAENLFGGLNKFLKEKSEDIKEYLIDMFNIGAEVMDMLGDLAVSIATIFMALGSDSGIAFTSSIFKILWEAVSNITLLISKLARDILNILVKPLKDNAESIEKVLEDVFGLLTIVTEAFANQFNEVGNALQTLYDTKLKPFFDAIADGLSGLVALFCEAWTNELQPTFQELASGISDLVNNFVTPMILAVIDTLGPLIDILKLLWNEVLQPFLAWLISSALPNVAEGINQTSAIFETAFKVIFSAVETVLLLLKDFLQFIVDVFTVGIDEAIKNLVSNLNVDLNKIKDIWVKCWDSCVERLKKAFGDCNSTLLSNMSTMLNNLKSKMSTILSNWKSDWEKFKTSCLDVWTNLGDKIGEAIDNIITKIEELLSKLSDAKSKLSDLTSFSSSSFSGFSLGKTGSLSSKISSSLKSFSINMPKFASGGYPTMGEMFIARESGPELVGTMNGKSAVANNDQITDGIRSAVYDAMVNALSSGNMNGDVIVNAILKTENDEVLARAVTRGQQSLNRRFSPVY